MQTRIEPKTIASLTAIMAACSMLERAIAARRLHPIKDIAARLGRLEQKIDQKL
jgi:hypothetical protein